MEEVSTLSIEEERRYLLIELSPSTRHFRGRGIPGQPCSIVVDRERERDSLANDSKRQLLFLHVVSHSHKVKVGRNEDERTFHQISLVSRQHLHTKQPTISHDEMNSEC